MAQAQPSVQPKMNALATALSGSSSGLVVSACLQPLDVVRTKMSTIGTASEVMRHRGVFGFWQGTAPSVIRVGGGVGVNMLLLESVKEVLQRHPAFTVPESEGGHLTSIGAALAGGVTMLLLKSVAEVVYRQPAFTMPESEGGYITRIGAALAGGAALLQLKIVAEVLHRQPAFT
eukprot:gene24143-9729_t